jgi:diguanylate cyclase (GGDEF)-like protein
VRDYALYVVDADGVVLSWSESAERVHQCGASDIVGQSMATLAPGTSGGDAHVRDLLRRPPSVVGGARTTAIAPAAMARRSRPPRWSPCSTPAAPRVASRCITRDLSERRRFEHLVQVRREAPADDLTGVATRRSFYDTATVEISRARRYGQPLTVLLVDPDRFREVNDTHGTEFGDECLRTIAWICRQESRNTDVIGRVGGEEFAVLLPSTELSGGLVLAERIRERMQRHVFPGDHRGGRCTVSVGVAAAHGRRGHGRCAARHGGDGGEACEVGRAQSGRGARRRGVGGDAGIYPFVARGVHSSYTPERKAW